MSGHQPRGDEVRVRANGLRHRVLRYGTSGPDLLLLPGITSPAPTMDFVAHELREHFRVHVPDVRGRGETTAPPDATYRLDDYAADAAGLIQELGLNAPTLLGHSMGARIAAATSQLVAHGPLVLVEPPLSGPDRPYPTSLGAFRQQLDEARAGATAADVARWYPTWDRRELDIRAQELPTCDPVAVEQTHHGFESEEFGPYWEELRAPVTLIRGADSPVVTEADMPALARLNPRASLLEVAHAGHMVPWDNLAGFFDAFWRTVRNDHS